MSLLTFFMIEFFSQKLVVLLIGLVAKGRVKLIQSGFFGCGKWKMKARFEPVTSEEGSKRRGRKEDQKGGTRTEVI